MKKKDAALPRFFHPKPARDLGLMLTVVGGFSLVMTVLATLRDESVPLIVVSSLLALALAVVTALGVLALLASWERIRITPEGVAVCLGGIPLVRLPAENIRSVVATTKEYREKMSDKKLYLLKLYGFRGHLQNVTLWLEWSEETEKALREHLPQADFLM